MNKTWQDRYVMVDGVKAHYIESGNGETVVLIHGGGESSCAELNYGDIMEPLGRHCRVIALDCVGHGETRPRGPEDYPANAQGAFLVKMIRALGLTNITVGGNSHGGWLCQYVAHEAKELVSKVVIINSLNGAYPIPPAPEGYKYIHGPKGHPHEEPTEEGVRESLLKFYVNKSIVTDERVKRTVEIARQNVAFARARSLAMNSTIEDANKNLEYKGKHISEWASQLDVPVLLTWSRENRGASPIDAMPLFNRIKDVEMHVFANAGHHVQTEHPERWSRVVADFVYSPR